MNSRIEKKDLVEIDWDCLEKEIGRGRKKKTRLTVTFPRRVKSQNGTRSQTPRGRKPENQSNQTLKTIRIPATAW